MSDKHCPIREPSGHPLLLNNILYNYIYKLKDVCVFGGGGFVGKEKGSLGDVVVSPPWGESLGRGGMKSTNAL